MNPLFRFVFNWGFRLALHGLHRAGFRGWHLTVLSLVANAVCGWLILSGQYLLPGLLLLPAALFDVFDGAVARLRGEDGPKGALLDSTVDRAADAIVLGCIYFSVAEQGRTAEAALAISALVVSLLVSHVKAEGEAGGLEISEGLFTRFERYLALMVGLTYPGALIWALGILTGLGGVTVVQRAFVAWRGLAPTPTAPGAR